MLISYQFIESVYFVKFISIKNEFKVKWIMFR